MADQPERLTPPWDEATVKGLNEYQRAGWMHPYTCGRDHGTTDLVAHPDGWHCPHPGCDYTQQWAHTWTLGLTPPWEQDTP